MNELRTSFTQALAEAEHQLHWGTDIGRIERAARDLGAFETGHVLARHLLAKVARLTAFRDRFAVDRRATAKPNRSLAN
jgi:hypothetical protein